MIAYIAYHDGRSIAEAKFFLLVDLRECYSDLGSGDEKEALKTTSLLVTLSFYNISRTNSKIRKVN